MTKQKINNPLLFNKLKLGKVELKNRFVMAPMTRSRACQPGDIPTDLMAKYYGQRSSAGLIISEATQISLQGKGYALTPGIYTEDQMEGWRKVTSEVHKKGSVIALQLWHVGRISHPRVNGLTPLAPSAIKANGTKTIVINDKGENEFIDVETPMEMTKDDINATINDFESASLNAINSGFDFVEVHGANGYLIDQFLRTVSNTRTDEYGGTKENRIRFLKEVTAAIVNKIGAEKVGVRLSPYITIKDMEDKDILNTIILAVKELEKLNVAFIHLCEADWDDAPEVPEEFRKSIRAVYSGKIIVTGLMAPEKGEDLIKKEYADLIGFGRKFISNPDYPQRVKLGKPLNEMKDRKFLFGGSEEGYTDYPTL